MKKLKLVLLLAVTGILLFVSSCENVKDELNGEVEFSVSLSDNNLLKSLLTDSIAPGDEYYSWHILVSIKNVNDEMVFDNEIIPLFSFGEDFISDKLSLRVGKYSLEKFMIVDPYGDIKYASPLADSRLAYLVNQPLPIRFEVLPNQTNHLVPEVLVVIGNGPEDFGYTSFGFEVVKPIVAYVMAVDDNPLYERPSIAVPAVLSLYARDKWSYKYKLNAEVNKILVKSGYEYFKIIVENADYPAYEGELSIKELMNSTEDNPVIFNLGEPALLNLFLRPGPDKGKDAMITDLEPEKNFGEHPLFEASFLSESILAVMRTKRSLIQFNLDALPDNARIKSVHLSLLFENIFWDSLGIGVDGTYSADERLVLQQIIEPWEENDVNWVNQPKTIEANQVFLPIWDELDSNTRIYDVTSLFVPIAEIAAPNYGMMLKLYNDEMYPVGWSFSSSDHPVEWMRPALSIQYSVY